MARPTSTANGKAKTAWGRSKPTPGAAQAPPPDLPDNLRSVAYAIGLGLRGRVLGGSDISSILNILNAIQRSVALPPRYRFQFARDVLDAAGDMVQLERPSSTEWKRLKQDSLVARVLVEISRVAAWTNFLPDDPSSARQPAAHPVRPSLILAALANVHGQIGQCLELLTTTAALNRWPMPSFIEVDKQDCHDVTVQAVSKARKALEDRRPRLMTEFQTRLKASEQETLGSPAALARMIATEPALNWRRDMTMAFKAIASDLGSRQQAEPFRMRVLHALFVRRHKAPLQGFWSAFGRYWHGAIATTLGAIFGAAGGWYWTWSLGKNVVIDTADALSKVVAIYGTACTTGAIVGGCLGLGFWLLARRSKVTLRKRHLTVLLAGIALMEKRALKTFSTSFTAYYGQLTPRDYFDLQYNLVLRTQDLISKLEDACCENHNDRATVYSGTVS